jgi:uncharacterized protein YdhG (YjbR/CyaY superfamily)
VSGSDEVDAYIAALPETKRSAMSEIRAAVRAGAPAAVEVITYKMPGLKLKGGFLLSYDAYKSHYSLFPWDDAMREELRAELERYVTGRGTIRFPADEPIPSDLIRRIAAFRVRTLSNQDEPVR